MIGIGVTGLPGSGKSVFSQAAESLGIPVIKMGDIVFLETKNLGLPLTYENVGKVAVELRKKYGRGIVAKKVIKLIQTKYIPARKNNIRIIVIEGIRSPEEVNYFRAFFDVFILIAIHAPPTIRYERLLRRGRTDDSLNISKLIERDKRELKFGIGEVIALSDEMLVNVNKTYEEFFNECVDLIKKIISKVKNNENNG